jgi:hypothetical protein
MPNDRQATGIAGGDRPWARNSHRIFCSSAFVGGMLDEREDGRDWRRLAEQFDPMLGGRLPPGVPLQGDLPMSVRFFLAVGLVISLPTLLHAQYNRGSSHQRQQQQMAAMQQPVELRGVIQGVAKGGLVVVSNNNQRWRVGLFPVTKVHITGTTTADKLRAGLIVEVTADIDDHGAIHGKVPALTVTSLSQDKEIGFFPTGDAKDDGVVDGFAADDKTKSKDAGKPPAKSGKRPPRTAKTGPRTRPAGTYRIVGRLTIARNGSFSIQVERGALPFDLASDAKIDIDASDPSFIALGNEITVKGFQVPNQPGTLRAADIQVKLPEPQITDQPEPPRHDAKKQGKRPPKKAKDQDEPPPEGRDE